MVKKERWVEKKSWWSSLGGGLRQLRRSEEEARSKRFPSSNCKSRGRPVSSCSGAFLDV